MSPFEPILIEAGLSNIEEKSYYGLAAPICFADYIYERNSAIIAKYILIQCNYEEFQRELCNDSAFYQEVISKSFFECCNTDLCWNIYQICVIDDEEYCKISREEILRYEMNTNYTRKILISYSELSNTIPVGKISIQCKQKDKNIINPQEIWRETLHEAKLDFCGDEYEEEKIYKYLRDAMDLEEEKTKKRRYKTYHIEKINQITIPANFRGNCFSGTTTLQFGKANILAGKNGSGKTSILEGIELVITGKVRKAKGIYKEYKKVTAINCIINKGRKMVKPDSQETQRRMFSWYHKKNINKQDALNSEFHLYNYFTAVDTFIMSYLGDKENLEKQFFQVFFGEESLRYYDNIEQYREKIKDLLRYEEKRQKDINNTLKLFETSKCEKEFFERVRKYSVLFDSTWDIEKIANIVKECIILCEQVENMQSNVTRIDLSVDKVQIDDQRQQIAGIEKEIREKRLELEQLYRKRVTNSVIKQKEFALQRLETDLKYRKEILKKYMNSLKQIERNNELFIKASQIIKIDANTYIIYIYNFVKELDAILEECNWYSKKQGKDYWTSQFQDSVQMVTKLTYMEEKIQSLPNPRYFLSQYVGDNVKQISDLFLRLQTPKEYDGLTYDPQGELVGVRHNRKVPLHMMSSGQRVAAVMALFFCMHLSADDIPNIILLDEPISHIDELNILSLFDLLRELVIKYDKQLFFTTSTQDVKKMFERKFSFLGAEYKEYTFERMIENGTLIKCRKG